MTEYVKHTVEGRSQTCCETHIPYRRALTHFYLQFKRLQYEL